MRQSLCFFTICLALCSCDKTMRGNGTDAAPETRPEAPVSQARPVIEFDREKLAALGIKLAAAQTQLDRFFATNDAFAGAELESLTLQTEQGLTVRLRDVATIHLQAEDMSKEHK